MRSVVAIRALSPSSISPSVIVADGYFVTLSAAGCSGRTLSFICWRSARRCGESFATGAAAASGSGELPFGMAITASVQRNAIDLA